MLRRVLTIVGAFSVVALVAGAVGALLVVKARIEVVIQEPAAAAGPSPVALLADDVAALRGEVTALQQALVVNFEQLGRGLDDAAVARHGELLAAVQRPRAVDAGLQQEMANVGERVRELQVAFEHTQRAVPPTAVAPSGEAAAAIAPPPPAATERLPAPEVPPVETPAPAQRTGFLSFSLPSGTFRFTEPQHFVLVPELCRVGFDAKSTLHDFTGVTSAVRGAFDADLDDPSGAWTGEIAAKAATLVTGIDGRDENLREHLDAAHHEEILFTLTRLEPQRIDAAKMEVAGLAHGRMTIRGKTRDVQMQVLARVDASRRLVIEGQMPLALGDYDVAVPSQLGGAIRMQDEVSVWVALRARPQAGGGR